LEENTEKNQATISNLQEEINCLKDQKEELTNKLIILQNEIVSLKD
jgi:chromosome segregation ATPase